MTRDEVITQLKVIASHMAEKYGYTEMYIDNTPHGGVWGDEFIRFLERKVGGDCTTEIKWKKPNDEYNSYVSFRFRFANPVITILFKQDDIETLASMEFTNSKLVSDGVYEKDTIAFRKGEKKYKRVETPWRFSESQIWNYDVALPYLLEMKGMWENFIKNA